MSGSGGGNGGTEGRARRARRDYGTALGAGRRPAPPAGRGSAAAGRPEGAGKPGEAGTAGPEAPPTVVCDLDGTLVDTARDLCGALDTVLAGLGLPALPFAEARLFVGHGALALLERGLARAGAPPGRHDLPRLRERFLAVYGARLTRESRPYPGVPETLAALAGRGHPLAVCTNKPEGLARRLLDELDLARPFGGAVVGRDTFPYRKPDARALEAAVRRAGGEPGRALLVGDSRTDVETARNAGAPVVLVTYGYRDEPVEALAPDFAIDDFAALAPLCGTRL